MNDNTKSLLIVAGFVTAGTIVLLLTRNVVLTEELLKLARSQ